jgi:peptide/nickel transport system substrate-binding protein
VDEIIFEIETDAARALSRFRKGEIDILPRLIDAHFPEQVAPAALGESATLHILSPERRSFLAINHRRDLLADQRVRRALSLLWDRSRLAGEFHQGLARPTGATTPATDPGFNPSQAARLLDDAGLRDSNGDGVRDRAGIPIRLKLVFSTAARTAVQELKAFAHDLRRAGLLAELAPTEPAALMPRLRAGDFDLAPLVWEARFQEDPGIFLNDLAFTGFRADHLTPLLDAWRMAPHGDLRRQARSQLDAVVGADLPVIFLYAHDVPVLAARRVMGLHALAGQLDFRGVALAP